MLKTTKSIITALLLLSSLFIHANKKSYHLDGLYHAKAAKSNSDFYLFKSKTLDVYLFQDKISYVTKNYSEKKVSGDRIDLKHLNNSNAVKLTHANITDKSNTQITFNGEMHELSKVDTVAFNNIYSNINLKYFLSNEGELTYHYFLSKGADVTQIERVFDGMQEINIAQEGTLKLVTNSGELTESNPITFNAEGTVNSNFQLRNNSVKFNIEDYSPAEKYTIDPIVSYTTYLGGTASDFGTSIAVDSASSVYGASTTFSALFPSATGTYEAQEDVVVFKIDSLGNLQWATYFGGIAQDEARAIAVSDSGIVYVTGYSRSLNLPNAGTNPGDASAFVLKLNNDGTISNARFIGGNGADEGYAIVTNGNNVAVTGVTSSSTNFPKVGLGALANYDTGREAFLTIMDENLVILSSGYFPGNSSNLGRAITADNNGNYIIAGETESTNLPTLLGSQTSKNALDDGFIARFGPQGLLNFATYYGGNNIDQITDVATDEFNNIYVTGNTRSTDLNLPTSGNSFQTTNSGNGDIFIGMFSATGTPLWSTYYGDTAIDIANSLTVSSNGAVLVTGMTESVNFPVDSNALQVNKANMTDAFILQFDSAGNRRYASFYGGNDRDEGNEIIFEKNQSSYVIIGTTRSTNLPLGQNAPQTSNRGDNDIFIYTSCGLIPNNVISSQGIDNLFVCNNKLGDTLLGTTPIGGSGNYTFKYQISSDSGQTFQDIPNSNVEDLPVAQFTMPIGYNMFRRIVTDGFCRDTSNTTIIRFGLAPTVDFSFDTVCIGDQTQFTDLSAIPTGTAVQSWHWEFGEGTDTTIQNPKFTYDSAATYQVGLTIKLDNSCDANKLDLIEINDNPTANFDFTAQCGNDTVQFINTSTNVSINEFSWDFGNGKTSTLENPRIAMESFDEFSVRFAVGNSLGCSDTTIKTIGIDNTISPSFTTTNNTCEDSVIAFFENTTLNGTVNSWNWNFDDGTSSTAKSPTKTYTNTGNYDVKLIVTTEAGCIDSVTQTVTVGEPAIADFNFVGSCVNLPVQFTDQSSSSTSTITSWNWDFGDGNTSTMENPSNTFTTSGTYTVVLTSATNEGCSNSSSQTITINDGPVIDAGSDITIFEGSSAQLSVTPTNDSLFYSWSPVSTLNSPNSANPIATPIDTTTYTVRATNAEGCITFDSVTVNVSPAFFIPTVFTPNGDGDNDVFEIEGISLFPNHSINIFNRWGSEIYSTVNNYQSSPWDGTYEGEQVPVGAYYYVLDLGDGSKLLKGTISILK